MRDLGGRGSELQWREVEIFSLRGEGNEIKLNIRTLRYVSISDEARDGLRVARRSRSGSNVRECANQKSWMNASFDTIKERERECSEGKDFTNAELLKKRLGNVSESEL